MILPDINLLVHAHNRQSPCHEQARNWWDETLDGTIGVGLAWVTLLGFIRISTHRGILANPMTADDVNNRIEDWLSLPHFQIIHPAEGHFQRLRKCLCHLGSAGNLTTDAHLATLAIERGYTLCSTDTDFARFPGLKWVNPIGS